MSDIPPPIEEQGPPPEVPAAPRRGIRAGKVAQRKRKAYIKFRLESEPDLTEDQIYIIHADKSQRPLYTLPGWTPDQLDEDDQPQTQEEASSSSVVPRSFSAEERVEIEVEVEEDIEVPVSSSSPTPAASSIPKATGEVPKYGRLIFVNPPPPPPRPSLSRPSEPKLRPTPKIRPAAPKIPPAAVLPPAPKVPEVAVLPPALKARSLPKPRPPPLQKARPAVPKEPNYPPPAAKEGPVEEHRGEVDGYIDSALIGGGSLLISPVTNRRIRLRDSVRRAVQRVILLDFHNTIDKVFMPGQKRPHTIAYPNNRPTLLQDVISWIKRLILAAENNTGGRTYIAVCTHINNSKANESWLRDCVVNSVEDVGEVGDSERCLLDLIIVTRQRTGALGKLAVSRQVFPAAELLILDDNPGIVSEYIRAGQQAFQILLPKRERCSVGRAYSNIFEAEEAILNWIARPF